MIYLDSSALVELVVTGEEAPALQAFIAARAAERHVTSALARVEVVRAVRHVGSDAVTAARALLVQLDQLTISEELLDAAADADPAVLRSLDAIHLASAGMLGAALSAFVTYDQRLAAAAAAAGLPVQGPH